MPKDDCLFCKIIEGSIPSEKVYEDDEVVAVLDIFPVTPGHTVVMLKEHTKDFISTDPDLVARLFTKVHEVAGRVMKAMEADGFSVALFNGVAAGQEVFHLHVHVIPRKSGDGVRVGWPKTKYAEGEMEKAAAKIRAVK